MPHSSETCRSLAAISTHPCGVCDDEVPADDPSWWCDTCSDRAREFEVDPDEEFPHDRYAVVDVCINCCECHLRIQKEERHAA